MLIHFLDGHYLNLPVMNEGGEIVGMVDVLKLTYATLEQINTMSTGDGEGPAWNKFWLSMEHETESMMSGEGSHSHHHTNLGSRMMSPDVSRDRLGDSVAPGDSASHVGADSIIHENPEQPTAEVPFSFKFKAPSGRVHRLQVIASQGIDTFVAAVASKLGHEVESIGGTPEVDDGKITGPGFAMSYADDEGDTVSITTDNDLLEAILLARHSGREKVDLYVHDPEKPPVVAPLPVQAPVIATPRTSSAAGLRERRRAYDDESEDDESDEDESTVRRSRRTRHASVQDQVIAGVPNELLLPGAIVTLAVVIIGVFTITRAASR